MPGPATPPARQRRLQRAPDFTGDRLSSFREVFWRHGLPGLALALCFLAIPEFQTLLAESLSRGSAQIVQYAAVFVVILLALNAYIWVTKQHWDLWQLGWILYLGALSFWEEWVFRLALPQLLEGFGASVWMAALLSALVFGGAHYFTLRWKWQWCVGAFFGALYFSRQLEVHGDLLLVAAIHWVATTLNTPRPPRPLRPADADQ